MSMIFASVWGLLNLSLLLLFIGGFIFILIKLNSIDNTLKEILYRKLFP
jgi:uncharacterized ion transporter superfamily protein YfcC